MDKQASAVLGRGDPLILHQPLDPGAAVDARLECLKLATSIISGPNDEHHARALKLAEQYAAFVLGTAKG